MKETQQKRRLGAEGLCAAGDLSIDGTQMAIWWVATLGFGRYLYGRGPKWQTQIGFPIFDSDDFGPCPLKYFNSVRILVLHSLWDIKKETLLLCAIKLDEVPVNVAPKSVGSRSTDGQMKTIS